LPPPPFFEASNSDKMAYLAPKHCFRLRIVVKKSDHFFGAVPHPNITSGGCQKAMCPLLVEGFEGGRSPPHRQENFGHVTG
jgi:hypothetical protein